MPERSYYSVSWPGIQLKILHSFFIFMNCFVIFIKNRALFLSIISELLFDIPDNQPIFSGFPLKQPFFFLCKLPKFLRKSQGILAAFHFHKKRGGNFQKQRKRGRRFLAPPSWVLFPFHGRSGSARNRAQPGWQRTNPPNSTSRNRLCRRRSLPRPSAWN